MNFHKPDSSFLESAALEMAWSMPKLRPARMAHIKIIEQIHMTAQSMTNGSGNPTARAEKNTAQNVPMKEESTVKRPSTRLKPNSSSKMN